ncbi:nucleotidyltransferase domain-containing protein [candidate division NPL-UPA2 bacterium]|nr:nucleotidyltransferase domain-containing protein [candidate division NPL-UPA2 bacterium]
MNTREIEVYRRNFLKRIEDEKRRNKERRRKALKDIEQIKKYLAEDVGVREIYLFGSILRDNFGKDSDIDIAVGGLRDDKFFPVYSDLDNFTDFQVELVDLDEEDNFFRREIRRRGKKIYERVQPEG